MYVCPGRLAGRGAPIEHHCMASQKSKTGKKLKTGTGAGRGSETGTAKPKATKAARAARARGSVVLRVVPQPVPSWPGGRDSAVSLVTAIAMVERTWHDFLAADTPDGAHKFRIAARQLRVLLHIHRRYAKRAGHLQNFSELRELLGTASRLTGPLRDLDVLAGELIPPLQGTEHTPVLATGTAAVLAMVADARKNCRTSVCAAVAELVFFQPQLAALRTQLEQGLHDTRRGVGHTGKRRQRLHAMDDLKKRWRHFRSLSDHLERAVPEALHDARKSLRTVRDALLHFEPLFKARHLAPMHKHLRRLQDAFGYLNDVESAKAFCSLLVVDPSHPEAHVAIGFLLGTHSDRARRTQRKLKPMLQKLAATKLARKLS